MTTRVIASGAVAKTSSTTDRNGTTTIRSKSTRPHHYLVCDDPNNHSPFVNPRAVKRSSETQEKGKYSGGQRKSRSWPCRSTTPSWILQSIALFDTVFVSWWIMHALQAYHEKIPISTKRKIIFAAWKWYLWIHNLVVCQWIGFYADQSFYTGHTIGDTEKKDEGKDCDDDATISDEFKAISTLLYPVQFYPVDVPRMRFSLSQLNSISPKEIPSDEVIERIECAVPKNTETDDDGGFVAPGSQRDHQTVSGFYVTNQSKMETSVTSNPTKVVLFWIYGGAYLAGDAEGNLSLANEFLVDCDADSVFIPSYRLAPEATIDDVLWDICWSYRYLLRRLEQEQQQQQQQQEIEIVMLGISSGGALALRLLQFLRDRSSELSLMPSFLEPLIDDILAISTRSSMRVAGAVLFAPYVDYRDPPPRDGSFVQNAKYDWIVSEAVQHYGLPYLNGFIPPVGGDHLVDSAATTNTNGRKQYSPLTHEMNDLPPLCLIASEHEACYDMCLQIVNKARGNTTANTTANTNSAGSGNATYVTIGLWKYMCHVFSMMQAFLPEGKASIEFSKDWIRTQTTNNNNNNDNNNR